MPGMGVTGGDDICPWLSQRVANTLVIGVGKQGGLLPLNHEARMTQPGYLDYPHPLYLGGCLQSDGEEIASASSPPMNRGRNKPRNDIL